MATPDYLQQVIVSGRKHAGGDRRASGVETGLFRRPSITSSVWASLDMLTVVVAAMLALRFRVVTPPEVSTLHVLPHLIQSSPNLLFFLYWLVWRVPGVLYAVLWAVWADSASQRTA